MPTHSFQRAALNCKEPSRIRAIRLKCGRIPAEVVFSPKASVLMDSMNPSSVCSARDIFHPDHHQHIIKPAIELSRTQFQLLPARDFLHCLVLTAIPPLYEKNIKERSDISTYQVPAYVSISSFSCLKLIHTRLSCSKAGNHNFRQSPSSSRIVLPLATGSALDPPSPLFSALPDIIPSSPPRSQTQSPHAAARNIKTK